MNPSYTDSAENAPFGAAAGADGAAGAAGAGPVLIRLPAVPASESKKGLLLKGLTLTLTL